MISPLLRHKGVRIAVACAALLMPAVAAACGNYSATIIKNGPATALPGSIITYTIAVKNTTPPSGKTALRHVVITDAIPPGLTFLPNQSSSACHQSGTNVVCSPPDIRPCFDGAIIIPPVCPAAIPPGATFTVTLAFQVPLTLCGPIVNQASVTAWMLPGPILTSQPVLTTIVCASSSSSSSSTSSSSSSVPSSSSSSSSATSASSATSSSSTAPLGCIQILKEAFNPTGERLSTVPAFTFVLDGATTVTNNIDGNATFSNVSLGTHTVTENVPSGWNLFNVTPNGGTVVVTGGVCSGMTFKNQQIAPSGAVSSTAPPILVQPSPPPALIAYAPPAQPCALSVSKTADRSEAQAGDIVRSTIVVRNEGGRNANGVVVTDEPDAGAVIVDPGGGTVHGNGVRWEIGGLGAGQSRSFSESMRIGNGLSVRNRVSVQSSDCGNAQAAAVVGIIHELPQTGFFGAAFMNQSPFLSKYNIENSSSGAVGWSVFIALLSIATAFGGFFLPSLTQQSSCRSHPRGRTL